MDLARVIGSVWCTSKDPAFEGLRLAIVQPLDAQRQPNGEPAVAIDVLNRSNGDEVYIVRSGDAMFAHHGSHLVPTDCAIAGLIDDLNVPEDKSGSRTAKP